MRILCTERAPSLITFDELTGTFWSRPMTPEEIAVYGFITPEPQPPEPGEVHPPVNEPDEEEQEDEPPQEAA